MRVKLTDINEIKDKFNELLEDIEKFFRKRLMELYEELFAPNEEEKSVESFLRETAENLEPETHCCECTPGDKYDMPHMVHIQYPDCNCKKEDFVLKRNY